MKQVKNKVQEMKPSVEESQNNNNITKDFMDTFSKSTTQQQHYSKRDLKAIDKDAEED